MEIEPKDENLMPIDQEIKPSDSNGFGDPALLILEEKINNAKFPEQAPREDFQRELMSKILNERRKSSQSFMQQFISSFAKLLTVRRLAPAVALLLIVAIIFGLINYWPGSKPGQFAKLIISPVYAQDNFQVTAEKSDSLGIESNTAFIVKSKEKLNPSDIKESLSFSPASDFDFEQIDDYTFRVTPKNQLEAKKVYNIKINASYDTGNGLMAERDYSWAFQVKDSFKILTSIPRNQATDVPVDTGIEIVFSNENYADWEKYFSIEPATEGRFEKHGRTLVFVPKKLQSGKLYTVTVKQGLPLEGTDKKLEGDYIVRFETSGSDYGRAHDWSFDFSLQMTQVPTNETPAFACYSYNLDQEKYDLTVYKFRSEEQFLDIAGAYGSLPLWAYQSRQNYEFPYNDLDKILETKVSLNKMNFQEYLVLPDKLPAGYYLVQAKVRGESKQILLMVSDLAVYASVSNNKTLVWVNDVISKQPVADAKINIVGSSATANTASDGVATLETKTFMDPVTQNKGLYGADGRTYFFRATQGDKTVILPIDIYPTFEEYSSIGSMTTKNNAYWNYFYTDRSLYQTSDKINFWGFLKLREGDQNSAKYKIRLTSNIFYGADYDRAAIVEQSLEIKNSLFSGQLTVSNLTPGYYSLELLDGDVVINTLNINIETYHKPAYQININPEKKVIFAGDKDNISIKAEFFDKTPVADLDLANEVYDFKAPANIKTDENGQAGFALETSVDNCQDENYCSFIRYPYLKVKPVLGEESDISAEANIQVFNANIDFIANIKQVDNQQATFEVKAAMVDLSRINNEVIDIYDHASYWGEAAKNRPFTAELKEISYNKVETGDYYDFINKVSRKTYRYDRVEKIIQNISGTTDDQGKYTASLKINPEKEYSYKIVFKDDQGRKNIKNLYFYSRLMDKADLSGQTESEYQIPEYDYYHLDFVGRNQNDPEPKFDIGQRVNLEFLNQNSRLPESEKNNYLYFKLQRGLVDYKLSTSSQYSFDFSDKHLPNIFVKGVWFDGRSYHDTKVFSGWGALNVSYDYDKQKLNIEVTTDKEKYLPGEQATIDVKVTNEQGQPVKAGVNINLVDEAFYKLSDEFVDPLSQLYSSVSDGEITSGQTHNNPLRAGGAEGGGCFAAGTMIAMADGSQKKIENVKVGDKIITYDNPLSKNISTTTVLQTFQHLVGGYLIINNHLKVTPEHRIFINNGWQTVGEAEIGDYFLRQDGTLERIESIEKFENPTLVYNLETAVYHTYFAGGIYVHNQKSGGRENFQDNALFAATVTDGSGRAHVSFKLPDNITSWRITAQAISSDLQAGAKVSNLIATLPLFVNATLNDQYLEGDKPEIKATVYGEGLKREDSVDLKVEMPDTNLQQSATTKPFIANYFSLGAMVLGEHKLAISAKSGSMSDRLLRTIKVKKTNLSQRYQEFYTLNADTKISNSSQGLVNLTITDGKRGQYYQRLLDLSYDYGDRLDQALTRNLADTLRQKYYQDEIIGNSGFSPNLYQLPEGGLSLLPYSSADLELSAKVANVGADYIDRAALAGYFYRILDAKTSNKEEVGLALYGLAGLNEPVLIAVNNYAGLNELTTREKLYSILALQSLGDKEASRTLYLKILSEQGEMLDQYVRINYSSDQDAIITDTALMAVAAAGINDEYQDKLWQYVEDNYAQDTLVNLERLMFLSKALPQVRQTESSFDINLGGQNISKKLALGERYYSTISADQLRGLKVNKVNGDVAMVVSYEAPLRDMSTHPDLGITKEYYDLGKKTMQFKENDLVQIKLYPKVNAKSPDGYFQITDILPSGLRISTREYQRSVTEQCYQAYPYQINGQQVKFMYYKQLNSYDCQDYIYYYARVITPGTYTAEPAMIQSFNSQSVKNFSGSGTINISR